MFYKLAVVGPILTGRLGLGQQCLACYQARKSADEPACMGFGPGCIGYRPTRTRAPADVADIRFRPKRY